jgi:hypothetical protein
VTHVSHPGSQASLEALRISDAEDYHVLKIRLETDIQVGREEHILRVVLPSTLE